MSTVLTFPASMRRANSTSARHPRLMALLVLGVLVLTAGGYLAYQRYEAQQSAAHGLADARAKAVERAKAMARAHAVSAKATPATKVAAAGSSRVVASTQSAEMFSAHSWFVAPVVVAAPVNDAPVEPTAPPLPYTYVGSFAPTGEKATFFLARGDRVIDAHVGDKLDGVLLFEKVEGNQLVFNYLPLNIRQTLPAGVVQ